LVFLTIRVSPCVELTGNKEDEMNVHGAGSGGTTVIEMNTNGAAVAPGVQASVAATDSADTASPSNPVLTDSAKNFSRLDVDTEVQSEDFVPEVSLNRGIATGPNW